MGSETNVDETRYTISGAYTGKVSHYLVRYERAAEFIERAYAGKHLPRLEPGGEWRSHEGATHGVVVRAVAPEDAKPIRTYPLEHA